MYTLKEIEKKTPAMFYTADTLFHGEVVTAKIVRVNIWLRTDNAPKYIHILNAQMISLAGNGHAVKLDELFLPTDQVIAYHPAPGVEGDLDYNENEPNRKMLPIQVFGPSFLTFHAENRISTQTDFGNTLESGRSNWISLYNITVSSPNLPKMSLQVPMLLLRPQWFSFGGSGL
jgi:hypothetical protein